MGCLFYLYDVQVPAIIINVLFVLPVLHIPAIIINVLFVLSVPRTGTYNNY